MTPAERLLAAADLLDKRAGEAAQPWELKADNHLALPMIEMPHMIGRTQTSSRYTVAGPNDATTYYIATMHPEVGKAQASWLLESAADLIDTPGTWTQHTLCARFIGHPDEANRCRHYDPALRLADLILAGAS